MSFTNTRDVIGDQATLDGLVAHTLTEFYEDGVNTLRSWACYYNSGLSYVEMPGITSGASGGSTFEKCTGLHSVSFPNMLYLAQRMFMYCSNLANVYIPEARIGAAEAFCECTSLQSANFPKMSRLDGRMFKNCISLSSFSFSTSMSMMPQNVFAVCSNISSVDFPSVTAIYVDAFSSCRKLNTVSFPSAREVYAGAFYNCPIKKLALPKLVSMPAQLTNMAAEVDLGSTANIAAQAFYGNCMLFSLILRNASMITLNDINAFTSTPISAGYGKIYVPSNLVSTYRSGTNWAVYAEQIDSLDNYTDGGPIIGETITDDWATILENNNYATDYSIGDTKWLSVNGGYSLMQIVAFDTDELADNTGNASITWLCKGYYGTQKMNTSDDNTGGWASSAMRAWLTDDILPTIDSVVRDRIKTVKKTFYIDRSASTETCNDAIWIPSYREVVYGASSGCETSGCVYTGFFADQTSRIKSRYWTDNMRGSWWLRTCSEQAYFRRISDSGGANSIAAATNETGVVFGFCT